MPRFLKAFAVMRPCFAVTDDEYVSACRPWLNAVDVRSWSSFGAVITIAGAIALAAIAYYAGPPIQQLGIPSIRPDTFDPSWWTTAPPAGFIILVLFGTTCGAALGTSATGLLIILIMLHRMRTMPTIILPSLIQARCRYFANLLLGVSVLWAGGVLLFVILLLRHPDTFGVAVVGLLALMGIALFAWPQWVFHSFIVRAYDWIAEASYTAMKKTLPQADGPTLVRQAGRGSSTATYEKYDNLISGSQRGSTWVYDYRDVALLVTGQTIPFTYVLVKLWIA
jgi:hypothetical protein